MGDQELMIGVYISEEIPYDGERLALIGAADEPVFEVIARIYGDLFSNFDGAPMLVVEPREGPSPDGSFTIVTGRDTLADLRLIIGPEDYRHRLSYPGFGADGELFVWVLDDLLPFGRTMLELYGGVEVARRVGQALKRYRSRGMRELADDWLRSNSSVPIPLQEAVGQGWSWTPRELKDEFGLDREGATRLMGECGYHWDPVRKGYYRPNDEDAVN